jgi:hypothetical protein
MSQTKDLGSCADETTVRKQYTELFAYYSPVDEIVTMGNSQAYEQMAHAVLVTLE